MKHFPFVILTAAVLGISVAGCTKTPEINVIPCPESIVKAEGTFNVAGAPVKLGAELDEETIQWANTFAQKLTSVTGKTSEVVSEAAGKCIELELNKELAPEEYWLDVTKKGVKIQASSAAGSDMLPRPSARCFLLHSTERARRLQSGFSLALPSRTNRDSHTEECILTLPVISSMSMR